MTLSKLHKIKALCVALPIALAGCSSSSAPEGSPPGGLLSNSLLADNELESTATPASFPTDSWIGQWVGVEGLVLKISPGPARGRYMLTITLMDGTNSYDGHADDRTIRFTRAGKEEVIRHTDGNATGLKWLANKKDCLTITPGEGFCRD